MFHDVCLANLHSISTFAPSSTHSITSPFLHLFFTPPATSCPFSAFSWRWLSHATKRSTCRSKSRRDSRRPREQNIEHIKQSNIWRVTYMWIICESYENHMKIIWKSYENHMKIIWKSCGRSSFPFNFLIVLYDQSSCKSQLHVSPGRHSFLSKPSLANKRLDSCTVMSWRHSSGTYHQTWDMIWQDWSAPVELKARNCFQHFSTKHDEHVVVARIQKEDVTYFGHGHSEGKHAKLRKTSTNSSISNTIYWGVRICSGPNPNSWIVQILVYQGSPFYLQSRATCAICINFACLVKSFSSNSR